MQLVGPERIALGTDYPFPLGELEPGALIDALAGAEDVPGTAIASMLGGSALEFLGLTADRFGR